jgi:pimeloyl-ACP methyl ester carboxylesterase
MARLEQVHVGDPKQPAIVFVHGLGGDLFDTWVGPGTSRDDCWLHWVGKDTGCDTLTLAYDSALSRWHDQAMPLPDQGTQVGQLLGVHPALRDRSIVLVGHSMGGLVIKTLITQSQAAGDERARSLMGRIRGVVFVATPHYGSQLVSLARAVAAVLRTNAQVGDMSRHDAHLRQLAAGFREQRRTMRLKVAAFAETRDVVRQDKSWFGLFTKQVGVRVVDPTSSDPGLEGVTTVPLAEDHFSICKPSSRDAQIHHALVAFIRDEIGVRPQVVAANHVSDSDREEPFTGKTNGAEAIPIDDMSAFQPNARQLALFDVYTPACGPYYVARPIDDSASRTLAIRSLWLAGQSGVGKTSLVRRYIDQNGIRPLEISFSQLEADALQQRITREIVEAVAAVIEFPVKGFDLIHAVEAIVSLPASTGIPLFFDEVPISPSNEGAVASTIGLLLDAVKRHKGTTVRFIACSIDNPLRGDLNGKFRENFSVAEVPRWTDDELQSLLQLIQTHCRKTLSPRENSQIVDAAAGSPRYVKTLMRNILQRSSKMELNELIQLTSTELRGL